MKDENLTKNHGDEETAELDIEVLTEIQGGIEIDDKTSRENCGLGCYIGSGISTPDNRKI